MLVTGAAVLWLAHRAWQTLWKPVPELIGILGVDVPDPPDVSLAGIRADAATLNWTRPHPNRPVAKFLIQVNGVNVGESANQETAITVTGLKPNHFYNIRVIAVGYNNFQAGSRVIRLRTFERDGRPQLGDGRLPSNFVPEEQQQAMAADHVDEDGVPRTPAAGVETISIPEIPAPLTREPSISGGPRRNTLTRKHSPSTTSMDQNVKDTLSNFPQESLQELGEKFQSIRKEIDETQAQISKDEAEHKQTMDELSEEKKLKRRLQKEKDDTTEKLKREMGSTDRAMRSAQQRKTQKEKLLREKQNERKKLEDEMAKWEKDIASMQKRQACFDKERNTLQANSDGQAEELRTEIALLQASYAQEEAELKEKSKVLKEAEEQRKKLPGGEESEEWRESDLLGHEWVGKARLDKKDHMRTILSLPGLQEGLSVSCLVHMDLLSTCPSHLSGSLSQRLNPNAPSFMGGFFRARPDRIKEAHKETRDPKDRAKGKGKNKESKEREPRTSVSTASEAATLSVDETPLESRRSRDTYSMDTPSITESRESLSLERSLSNTPSDSAMGHEPKEEASGFKKLLRKGSSSKFSLSSVRGLGGKKGPGSATNSDRNMSVDRTSFDEFAEENNMLGRSFESITSSPSMGPIGSGKPAKDKGVNWGRFSMKRKPGKEKESLDLDRSQSQSQISPAGTSVNGDEK
ncbi:putative fibronectin type iii domain-containing protein [Eutypa lata UCREL1]|uniref:Putative fibronectin type iii domain-containing protein n=1 Tax=Eutypa lata (strain UCR-EL1) TaxID=1287681 RepID=M7SF82_EUTLA|nr:putative fibronectin type iii domain-containing protein [Eutypa lata UCREL1]